MQAKPSRRNYLDTSMANRHKDPQQNNLNCTGYFGADPKKANRLTHATSPYLLQHAHNPVDWFPWGNEALSKARAEDKPIFLSIGYSACHWCHVMERESFEDEAIATVLNQYFVPIKVDREERPDLDELYMAAVQAITGRGGWPMSVWLTPDLKPFTGGTYIPPRARFGSPGFLDLLERIAELWRERREDILQDAGTLAREVERHLEIHGGATPLDAKLIDRALEDLRRSFDPRWGGFTPAPKFPAHMAVDLLMARGKTKDIAMVSRTLDAMWEGGLYDHLGGGFARYSTDERWLVPHFEKMLYDNALLACCYLDASLFLGQPDYAEVARATLDYLLREMQDEAGGFYSSEDADSEGEEGRYYTWTPDEVATALGKVDGAYFCDVFGIIPKGQLEGRSILHRFDTSGEPSPNSNPEASARIKDLREKLRLYRETRPHPGKDDKILVAWNGLAIRALSRGFSITAETRYLNAALACARFLKESLWREGSLLRVWRHGKAHTPGFLEDYAALAYGLVDLYEASFDVDWLRWAEEIADAMRTRFEDARAGGFFTTEEKQADVLFRVMIGHDGALPSGNTLAIQALLRLADHLDRDDFRHSAERALLRLLPAMEHTPRAHLALLAALDRLITGSTEVVIAGDPADARTGELLAVARKTFIPRGLITMTHSDPKLPLHLGRTHPNGTPAAYVCRNNVCSQTLHTGESLALRLSEK